MNKKKEPKLKSVAGLREATLAKWAAVQALEKLSVVKLKDFQSEITDAHIMIGKAELLLEQIIVNLGGDPAA